MRAITHLSSTTAMASTQPHAAPPLQQQQQHSTWRSPVPYLFGGLAAMMGLIAFALLLLACSYWRLSGYLEEGNGSGDGSDPESGAGGKPDDAGAAKAPPCPPEQRIVVIMAGDEKPTFLATPVSSRASSFGDNAGRSRGGHEEDKRPEDKYRSETTAAGGDDDVAEAAGDGGRQQGETQESQESAQWNHERSDQNPVGGARRSLPRDQ